jgi:FixJ family two-component response regulator
MQKDAPPRVIRRNFVIAVVDDDRRVLESLESLLESSGLTVRLFESAEQFIASGSLKDVDCLISDIGMPVLSGLELLTIVRQQYASLPVILITGRATEKGEEYYLEQGAQRFFHKPFDGRALLGALQQVLRVDSTSIAR